MKPCRSLAVPWAWPYVGSLESRPQSLRRGWPHGPSGALGHRRIADSHRRVDAELAFLRLRAVSARAGLAGQAEPPAGRSWPVMRSGPASDEAVLPGHAACFPEGREPCAWLLPAACPESLKTFFKAPLVRSGSEDSVTGPWSARDRWADLRVSTLTGGPSGHSVVRRRKVLTEPVLPLLRDNQKRVQTLSPGGQNRPPAESHGVTSFIRGLIFLPTRSY